MLIYVLLILLLLIPGVSIGADSSSVTAAGATGGLPPAGTINDCVLNTAPGTGTWQACPGAAGGDSVTVNGAATVNPDFATTSSDLTLTNTANVITFTLKSGLTISSPVLVTPALGTPASGVGTNLTGIPFTGLTGSATDAQIPNNITVDLATTATTANAGDSATSFFPSGTIEDARLPTSMADKAITGSLNIPHSVTLPATCAVGNQYMDTDATTGQRHYLCEATNTWVLQGDGGGGGGSSVGANTAVQGSNGAGAFTDTGCTATGGAMTCAGGFTAGTSGAGVITVLEGTVVSAGASAGEHNLGFDSADSLLKSRENAGSLVTYYSTANPPTSVSGNAGTATALTANPVDCSANQFANTIAANGNLTCAAIADADVPDTITVSNYLPLAGGTLTGLVTTDNLGIEFTESDVNPTCAAGNFNIFADLSENKLKKCVNGSATDLDTTGGTPDFGTITGGTNTTAAMIVGTGGSLAVSGSGTIAATTSAALAANGGNCSTGSAPLGVDTQGAVEGCTDFLEAGDNIGAATATTASANDNDTSVATTAYVQTELTAYASDTATFTGKTYDAEGTGNVLTIKRYKYIPAAGCNNVTAGSVWDLPTTNAAVAACRTGTNTQKGTLDFADGSNLSAQYSERLNEDWTGAIDTIVTWISSTTTNDVVWQVAIACAGDGESDDPAFTDDVFTADTAKGTGNQYNDTASNTITTTGTCAVGKMMHVRLKRDSAHASDNHAGTARAVGVTLKMREAQ